jgi:hypothetical protein
LSSSTFYIVRGIKPGDNITCTLEGTNGDADLHSIPFEGERCSSANGGSIEECTVGPAVTETILIIEVEPYAAYTNLTIECYTSDFASLESFSPGELSSPAVNLTSGVPFLVEFGSPHDAAPRI